MNLRRMIAAVVCSSMVSLALPGMPAVARDSNVYTARQIFEGVFFARGPVAQRLPDYWGNSSLAPYRGTMRSADFGKVLGALEMKIARHDPTYFPKLEREMTSGDPGLVQQAVETTNREIAAVMPKGAPHLGGDNPFTAPSKDGDAQDTVMIILLVVIVVVTLSIPYQQSKIASHFFNDRVISEIALALRS